MGVPVEICCGPAERVIRLPPVAIEVLERAVESGYHHPMTLSLTRHRVENDYVGLISREDFLHCVADQGAVLYYVGVFEIKTDIAFVHTFILDCITHYILLVRIYYFKYKPT